MIESIELRNEINTYSLCVGMLVTKKSKLANQYDFYLSGK